LLGDDDEFLGFCFRQAAFEVWRLGTALHMPPAGTGQTTGLWMPPNIDGGKSQLLSEKKCIRPGSLKGLY
jgi:hypothetical protein